MRFRLCAPLLVRLAGKGAVAGVVGVVGEVAVAAARAELVPPMFHGIPGWLGNVTADRTVPQLRKFAEAGGTIITIGSSTNLGYHLGQCR